MRAESGMRVGALLSLTGVIFSAMLLYHHVAVNSGFQVEKSFCSISPGFDCDAVARSEYSELFVVPVASYSLLFYLGLYLMCHAARLLGASADRRFSEVLFAAGLLALFPSVVFFSISMFVIKTVCLMCAVLYLVGISLFIVANMTRDRSQPMIQSFLAGLRATCLFFWSGGSRTPSLVLVGRLSFLLALTTWFMLLFAPSWIQKEILFPKADSRSREKMINEVVTAWKSAEPQEIFVNRSADLQARDFVRGEDSAPFVLTMFSDFECPFCKRTAQELHDYPPEILRKLRIVFKNYPLDDSCNRIMRGPLHHLACRAALYGRCAGAQGEDKFWRMHDALFTLRDFSEEAIAALPAALGLDSAQFTECLSSQAPLTKIHEDIEHGVQAHVEGTPALFLNGRPLMRATPEIFLKIFEDESAGK